MVFEYNPDDDMYDRIMRHFDWNVSMPSNKRSTMLRSLRDTCKDCIMCPLGRDFHVHHHERIDPHVFSNMNMSKIMVVGQNPGFHECKQDEPFVGEAGENFNREVEKHGLSRDHFYITNICKCHTTDNRKPTTEEIQRCFPFLLMEKSILIPKLIVTLGAASFDVLCDKTTYKAGLGKFSYSDKLDAKIFAVYHPSPRNLASRRNKFERQIELLCGIIKHTIKDSV